MPTSPVKPEATSRDVEPAEPTTTLAAKRRIAWRRWFTRRWLAVWMGCSVALFGLIYIYCVTIGPARFRSPEVSLGTFQFASAPQVITPITAAEFDLHVALLTEVDRQARLRLAMRRFRVQQDIEQLMRRAQGGDFEDPSLAELKRQLQEQINESLGMRAVADVIITDLRLTRAPGENSAQRPAPATADAQIPSPWRESPPSTVAVGR